MWVTCRPGRQDPRPSWASACRCCSGAVFPELCLECRPVPVLHHGERKRRLRPIRGPRRLHPELRSLLHLPFPGEDPQVTVKAQPPVRSRAMRCPGTSGGPQATSNDPAQSSWQGTCPCVRQAPGLIQSPQWARVAEPQTGAAPALLLHPLLVCRLEADHPALCCQEVQPAGHPWAASVLRRQLHPLHVHVLRLPPGGP